MIKADIYLKKISKNSKQSQSALGLLYSILKEKYYLPAEDTCIIKGEKGKPYLLGCKDIQFSISHSGEYVCVAISSVPIGVDIQKVVEKREKLAKRFFSEEESKAIEDGESFFSIWTRKEALLKADGCGITVNLNSVPVDTERVNFKDRKYTLKTLTEKVPEGYYLSVAVLNETGDDFNEEIYT